ncbi:glycine--tRNA ligase subunit beta [Roseateles sp. DAIF2]|uniref:glycine--tRNA ligase subunit beta n=1 Tax=Roseateles sp. DAIF2 TaxID=2714952 RepID=UPI0018A2E011|nr:glycine--tRNA ligase subunit beta [Roseateles sp. DAIF2]QPF75703.1 glycine--tRNA ligase subunit beta [Roseateles sp. DAIF2]
MSATPKNLLVELFVEELPPKALKKLGEAFCEGLLVGLEGQGLVDRSEFARAQAFASPRRLAVLVPAVRDKAEDKAETKKLVPVGVGLDAQGQPTQALIKKLASLGLPAEASAQVYREPDGKAEALFIKTHVAGATLAEGLQKALDATIAKLPIPKVMTYQLADGWSDVKFVRPAHGLVALHGSELVPVAALGLQAGRATRGHRFESAVAQVEIESADSYAAQLREQGAVIASFTERRAEIVAQLNAAAAKEGLKPIEDEALLDEVTALVERPNVLTCQFETEFLAVPQECLILTMKANQKYFPLLDAAGKLTHKFLVVSNIRPADASAVTGGNERVVRPRLSDAKFFFDQDRKKSLADRVPGLAKVVYHGKLGSQGERVERVRAIAKAIAAQLGASAALAADIDSAAHLAKADLLTDMVGEFPELQGIMGGYYARHDGLSEAVAFAIEDHYKPRFAGDELPRNEAGLVVALADKLETLVGLFGIGQLPTGDKDPFALRRHALGVVRMLSESPLTRQLGLDAVIAAALPAFAGLIEDPSGKLLDFVFDRVAVAWRDAYSAQEVDAVLALRPQRLAEVRDRLAAVQAFAALPEAASLAAANKRIGNILKKSEEPVEARIDPGLLKEPAEQQLAQALQDVAAKADREFHAGAYTASLRELAALKAPVDAFFDGVMVNAEDAALRANRLGLLKTLHEAMNRVADLARLAS